MEKVKKNIYHIDLFETHTGHILHNALSTVWFHRHCPIRTESPVLVISVRLNNIIPTEESITFKANFSQSEDRNLRNATW